MSRWPRQPSGTTCGPSVLVVARALHDDALAARVLEPTGFRAEVLAAHRELTALRVLGGWQLPWVRALGTPPWALARALRRSGAPYRSRRVGGAVDRVRSAGLVDAALARGLPVPIFVGNGAAPEHVVLAVESAGDSWEVYDPARGALTTLTRRQYVAAELPFGRPASVLRRFGPMTRPWFVVVPG